MCIHVYVPKGIRKGGLQEDYVVSFRIAPPLRGS